MAEQKKELQIVQLVAKNVTNLKAIRITPEGKTVVLTGANEAGKSNVLDVIRAMLEGLKLKMPIREGQERGDAFMDLGDIKIERTWTGKTDRLEVYSVAPGGKKLTSSSPQTFLNELTGKMIDPMKLFKLMKDSPKQFRNMLAKLVGLDLGDIYAEDIRIRGERKLINDKIKDSIAQLKGLAAPDPETPEQEISFKEELEKINILREKKKNFDDAFEAKDVHKEELRAFVNTLADVNRKIKNLEEAKKEIVEAIDKKKSLIAEFQLPQAVTKEQITAAEAALQEIENKNVVIRAANRYRKHIKAAEKHQKDSDKFSEQLNRLEQDKTTRIGACKFPVPGLSLTDEQVIFEGKPIEIASSSRQIRIFTEIAMALSPQIKVLLIKDGSLLDSNGFKEICAVAESRGYQIWVEKVDESGQIGIFIEDGEIKAIDGKETKKEVNKNEA